MHDMTWVWALYHALLHYINAMQCDAVKGSDSSTLLLAFLAGMHDMASA